MFVIGLDPPIRQGQTRYPFLVFQIDKDEEVEVSLNLTDEQLEKDFSGKLQKDYDAPLYEVLGSVFKALSGRKITVPSTSYKSHHGASAIKCSLKANESFLYPLERSFLFIPKPPTFIPHSDIASVTVSRVEGAMASRTKTIEMKFNLKGGGDVAFGGIAR